MKRDKGSIRGLVAFTVAVTVLCGLLTLLWMDGAVWAGALVVFILSFLLALLVVLQWSTFRLLLRISERQIRAKSRGSSNQASEATSDSALRAPPEAREG